MPGIDAISAALMPGIPAMAPTWTGPPAAAGVSDAPLIATAIAAPLAVAASTNGRRRRRPVSHTVLLLRSRMMPLRRLS